MRKNVAGQFISFQLVSATDGSNVTAGSPAVYYTIDAGTQGTGSGTIAHEGNGQWSYAPAQAETNGTHVAFTIVLAGAISQTVNVYPVSFDPSDSVRLGLTALPNAAADGAGGLPISDAGGLDLDAKLANTNEVTAARMGALTDWIDGGRLDLILDAVPTVAQIWTTALTEAYRSTGATGTAAQLFYEIIAHLGESSISGTTKTLKKLDGSTTAKTYTLDSATEPTSITEAT